MTEIRVKRIYEEVAPEDGRRVLVDRLWPRGVKKERIDLWAKDLAPSDELRREFHGPDFDFDEFQTRYLIELEEMEEEMRELLASTDGPLTLLFASKNLDLNNATVLAGALDGLDS